MEVNLVKKDSGSVSPAGKRLGTWVELLRMTETKTSLMPNQRNLPPSPACAQSQLLKHYNLSFFFSPCLFSRQITGNHTAGWKPGSAPEQRECSVRDESQLALCAKKHFVQFVAVWTSGWKRRRSRDREGKCVHVCVCYSHGDISSWGRCYTTPS